MKLLLLLFFAFFGWGGVLGMVAEHLLGICWLKLMVTFHILIICNVQMLYCMTISC